MRIIFIITVMIFIGIFIGMISFLQFPHDRREEWWQAGREVDLHNEATEQWDWHCWRVEVIMIIHMDNDDDDDNNNNDGDDDNSDGDMSLLDFNFKANRSHQNKAFR